VCYVLVVQSWFLYCYYTVISVQFGCSLGLGLRALHLTSIGKLRPVFPYSLLVVHTSPWIQKSDRL